MRRTTFALQPWALFPNLLLRVAISSYPLCTLASTSSVAIAIHTAPIMTDFEGGWAQKWALPEEEGALVDQMEAQYGNLYDKAAYGLNAAVCRPLPLDRVALSSQMPAMRFKAIICQVLTREIQAVISRFRHAYDLEFILLGLHSLGAQKVKIDICGTCKYATHMAKMIQVRNVPDSLHRSLKARAAMAGMSLSDYLLLEFREIADRPTLAEFRERLHARKPVAAVLDTADLVREVRQAR